MAYFAFKQRPDQEFVFELKDEWKIAHARQILSGRETGRVAVMGRILKEPAPYNPNFSYHLDPATIDFISIGLESCDANMADVEDRVDEACGEFLPGCLWCPWDSRLTREVSAG